MINCNVDTLNIFSAKYLDVTNAKRTCVPFLNMVLQFLDIS